jgi:small-conductance mechanosensitive channel/CRP-like cAMP-binding protein
VPTWSAILAEARDDHTLALLIGALAMHLLVRVLAPAERPRAKAALVLAILHTLLVAIAAALSLRNRPGFVDPVYRDAKLGALVLGALSAIGVASLALFALALPRIRVHLPSIVRDVIVAVGSLLAIFTLASRAGVNLSGIIATSAIVTAVIGLSLQDTLGNIMGGLALQLDNAFQVGDWIKVGDTAGIVREIRWRSTSIETRNWETVVLPNSLLVKNQFLVLGRREGAPLQWRRWVYFNVDFRTPPSDVIAAVTEALRAAPIERVAAEPPPNCILMDLSESYGRYAVRYWLTDLAQDDPTDSVVRTRVYFALKRVGIPLSMPAHAVFLTEETDERKADKERRELERRLRALDHVDFFDHLSPQDRERLAHGLKFAPFARGEVMTHQGAEAHWLYLIVHGQAVVRVRGEGGQEREVAQLHDGNFFGEMGLMTGEPRSATVIAESDVECYRLDKMTFQEIIRERPELATGVADVLAKRRVGLIAAREDLDAEERERRLAAARHDLLARIRSFFGLGEVAEATAPEAVPVKG